MKASKKKKKPPNPNAPEGLEAESERMCLWGGERKSKYMYFYLFKI